MHLFLQCFIIFIARWLSGVLANSDINFNFIKISNLIFKIFIAKFKCGEISDFKTANVKFYWVFSLYA